MPSIIRAIPVSNFNLNQPAATLLTNSVVETNLNGKTILDPNPDQQVILPQIVQEQVQTNCDPRFITPILKQGRIVNSKLETMISKKPGYSNQSRESVTTSSPVSLLKKVVNGTVSKQNWKNIGNGSKPVGRILNISGPIQNAAVKSKLVSQNNVFSTSTNVKSLVETRSEQISGEKTANVSGSGSNNKVSGSGDQVIQIVQQGQTLHRYFLIYFITSLKVGYNFK